MFQDITWGVLACLSLQGQPAEALRGRPDWLLADAGTPVRLEKDASGKELVLSNGLLARTFRTSPNFATVGFQNLVTDTTVIRGVKPEAVLVLDGKRYDVGGLKGQKDYAYLLPEW